MFGGRVFEQTAGIRMGTNCAPFPPIYSFIRMKLTSYRALYRTKIKSCQSFDFTYCYIDDVLSLNNSKFGYYVDRIYPIELEIKDSTEKEKSTSCQNLHLELTVRADKQQTLQVRLL